MDNLNQEVKQLAKEVNNDTKHKLNSNKGVITNNLEELKQLNNEIMDFSTDEQETTNIMVASTDFEVKVHKTLSIIEEVSTDKFRIMLNIDDPIFIEKRFNQRDMTAGTSSPTVFGRINRMAKFPRFIPSRHRHLYRSR